MIYGRGENYGRVQYGFYFNSLVSKCEAGKQRWRKVCVSLRVQEERLACGPPASHTPANRQNFYKCLMKDSVTLSLGIILVSFKFKIWDCSFREHVHYYTLT